MSRWVATGFSSTSREDHPTQAARWLQSRQLCSCGRSPCANCQSAAWSLDVEPVGGHALDRMARHTSIDGRGSTRPSRAAHPWCAQQVAGIRVRHSDRPAFLRSCGPAGVVCPPLRATAPRRHVRRGAPLSVAAAIPRAPGPPKHWMAASHSSTTGAWPPPPGALCFPGVAPPATANRVAASHPRAHATSTSAPTCVPCP